MIINRLNFRSKFYRAIRFLYKATRSGWGRLFLATMITMPTYFIALYFQNSAFNDSIKKVFPDALTSAIDGEILFICVVVFLFIFLSQALFAYIEEKIQKEDTELANMFSFLLEILEQPVAVKAQRFAEVSQDLVNNETAFTREQVFEKITQPEAQIKLICKSVYEFFCQLCPDTTFRVRLIEIIDNKPADWFHWEPYSRHPITKMSSLQGSTSTISECLRTRRPVLIPDIRKECEKPETERKFILPDEKTDELGSLFCYPIVHNHTDSIPYVLCVSTNKPSLKKEYMELYLMYMEKFLLRISLEHSLLTIKEVTSDD